MSDEAIRHEGMCVLNFDQRWRDVLARKAIN